MTTAARKRVINKRKRLLVVESVRKTVTSGTCMDQWTEVLVQQFVLEMLKDHSFGLNVGLKEQRFNNVKLLKSKGIPVILMMCCASVTLLR